MPEYAHDLGTDEAGVRYTILLGANAAGALAGGLFSKAGLLQARPQTAILFTVLWCLVVTGFAAATNYPLAVALMFVAGFLNLAFSAMSQTLVQVHAPAQLRGRLIGLYNTANSGCAHSAGSPWRSRQPDRRPLVARALRACASRATLILWAFSMRTDSGSALRHLDVPGKLQLGDRVAVYFVGPSAKRRVREWAYMKASGKSSDMRRRRAPGSPSRAPCTRRWARAP